MPDLSPQQQQPPPPVLSTCAAEVSGVSSQDEPVVVVPTFSIRKPSTCDNERGDDEGEYASLIRGGPLGVIDEGVRGFCLQVHSADVCRICQCGPNTLAAPTPILLTPITARQSRIASGLESPPPQEPSTSTLNSVSIELKRTQSTQSPPPHHTPLHQPPTPKKKPPLNPPDYNLISPCVCSGTLKYVHQSCLQNWIRTSSNTNCELCKHPFTLRSKFKPLWKWESLPMQAGDKKRIVCSALFHTVALACVVWSLYVLIDRTIEELTQSDLEWQFWTKIIVEAIGCLGAGILTYVWGKTYVSLFIKWISFNRSFVILGREIPQQTNPPQIVIPPNPPPHHHNQEQELINLIG